MSESNSKCFHCGLPVPSGSDWSLAVNDETRRFCCPGCQAVCKTIVEAGLHDYYRYRDAPSGEAAAPVPEFLTQLALYDRPEIQSSFVRSTGAAREAALILENIRCPACLWLNEQHLRSLDGVIDVEIDYTSERARVSWDPERIQLSTILRAISEIGYVAHPYDPAHRDQLVELQKRRNTERLIFAGLLAMPLMQFAFATYAMGHADAQGQYPLWVVIGRWTSLLAAAAILAYPAQDFFVGAWNDLKNRRLGMDVPIVLGLTTAFLGSAAATVRQVGDVYYDSIAMFVFFILLARRFEMKGRLAAAGILDRLARVVPRSARRINADGRDAPVPVVDLQPGDRLRVLPGETVPVDGRLTDGRSSFDESLLTGESAPVARGTGEAIIGGARNIDQAVVLEVTHRSEESTASEMQQLLRRALRSRPRSAILAERAATWFVVGVLLIAAGTAAAWTLLDSGAVLPNTVAVLIVTCPCALALATPVAVSIGASQFVARGIMAVRMSALETLARADLFVFDKTGTLTEGQLVLTDVHCTGDLTEAAAFRLAAALERDSEHPIGKAFLRATEEVLPEVTERHNCPGEGIRARVNGRYFELGKPSFIGNGLDSEASIASLVTELEESGKTVVVLADRAGVQAVFALQDRPRPGLGRMVEDLRLLGVREFAILSGDQSRGVAGVAEKLGIQTASGGLLPEDKMAWVERYQRQGRRVAMVGDGINDAGTLAAADVSISFVGATELAQSGSDFLLLNDDIRGIARARRLAQYIRRTIMQNLMWAATYNVLAVPAAAVGLIPPWGAAIGMSVSSLIVVGNSLRLRHVGTDPARAESETKGVSRFAPVTPPNAVQR